MGDPLTGNEKLTGNLAAHLIIGANADQTGKHQEQDNTCHSDGQDDGKDGPMALHGNGIAIGQLQHLAADRGQDLVGAGDWRM